MSRLTTTETITLMPMELMPMEQEEKKQANVRPFLRVLLDRDAYMVRLAFGEPPILVPLALPVQAPVKQQEQKKPKLFIDVPNVFTESTMNHHPIFSLLEEHRNDTITILLNVIEGQSDPELCLSKASNSNLLLPKVFMTLENRGILDVQIHLTSFDTASDRLTDLLKSLYRYRLSTWHIFFERNVGANDSGWFSSIRPFLSACSVSPLSACSVSPMKQERIEIDFGDGLYSTMEHQDPVSAAIVVSDESWVLESASLTKWFPNMVGYAFHSGEFEGMGIGVDHFMGHYEALPLLHAALSRSLTYDSKVMPVDMEEFLPNVVMDVAAFVALLSSRPRFKTLGKIYIRSSLLVDWDPKTHKEENEESDDDSDDSDEEEEEEEEEPLDVKSEEPLDVKSESGFKSSSRYFMASSTVINKDKKKEREWRNHIGDLVIRFKSVVKPTKTENEAMLAAFRIHPKLVNLSDLYILSQPTRFHPEGVLGVALCDEPEWKEAIAEKKRRVEQADAAWDTLAFGVAFLRAHPNNALRQSFVALVPSVMQLAALPVQGSSFAFKMQDSRFARTELLQPNSPLLLAAPAAAASVVQSLPQGPPSKKKRHHD